MRFLSRGRVARARNFCTHEDPGRAVSIASCPRRLSRASCVCVCYGPTGRGVCSRATRTRHTNMARVRDARTTRAGSHAE
eukprot:7278576-Prymnesium_polylepis.1